MPDKVRCKDCGFLGQRVTSARTLVDADELFRDKGDCRTESNVGHNKLCDPYPVCFPQFRRFHKEVKAQPNDIADYISREIDCPHFQPWQPGVAPQELADMIYQQKLLNEQRDWQANQALLADERHKDSLREVARATKWNWWAVLVAAGIGALATLMAGIIGAMVTLLWKNA